MFDERVVERWVDRMFEAVDALTKQVSRVAYAVEVVVIHASDDESLDAKPCRACSSRLVPVMADECPACGTYKEPKPNV